MKRNIFKILILSALLISSSLIFAQANPPNPPVNPGEGGGPVGGGAPIDGGLGILMILGAAYGSRKLSKPE